ncbi:MAG: hypothetical protein K9G59_13140 [Caulobacter sp.]|nr:hypothetical protein [Caulobacter sp.]
MAAESPQSHGADTAHTTTTEAEHGSGGLPQFQFQHWGGQIAYLLVLFVILYVLISRVFTPRMRRVLDERASTIATALDTARQVQAEALDQARTGEAEVAEARARSQRVAAEARAKAAADSAAVAAVEDAKVAEKVAAAEAQIQKARDAAMANVAGIAEDIASAIVAKLTGTAPAAADVKAALAGRPGAR